MAAASGRLGSSSGEIPDETTSVLARGTYLEVVSSRIGELGEFAAHILTAGPVIGALMLVGRWVQREGIVAAPHEHLPFLRRWTAIGLGAGLVVNATAAWALGGSTPFRLTGAALLSLGGPLLAAGYLAGMTLLFQQPRASRIVGPLAAVGRMTLTNYLLQSVICTTVFYGYGLGWFGTVGTAAGVALTLAIFAVQIAASMAWLRFFRFGPVEWLWRFATYLRRPDARPAG